MAYFIYNERNSFIEDILKNNGVILTRFKIEKLDNPHILNLAIAIGLQQEYSDLYADNKTTVEKAITKFANHGSLESIEILIDFHNKTSDSDLRHFIEGELAE